jgi:hypothetical protein
LPPFRKLLIRAASEVQVGWDGSAPEEAHRAKLEEVSSKKPNPQPDAEEPEEADENHSAHDGFARPSQSLIGADRPMKPQTSEDAGDSYRPLDKALKYISPSICKEFRSVRLEIRPSRMLETCGLTVFANYPGALVMKRL